MTEDAGEREPARASASEARIEALRAELEQERDRYLRMRADFENQRRRAARDLELASREAKRGLLLALVELADGFERALVHVGASPDAVAEGLHGMQRRLESLLGAEGVTPIESVGLRFDPTLHEAVATVSNAGDAEGTVVDVVGRGYLWGDELLRPARVRVAA